MLDLFEATFDKVITRKPDVLTGAKALEGDLILVGLFQLLPRGNFIDEPLLALDNNERTILHLLGFLFRNDTRCLAHVLQILTGLVTPEHIFERGLVEVVINVVEGVLSNIADDQVRMLPDLTTLVGFHIADEKLDKCRFTRPVGSENRNTRG